MSQERKTDDHHKQEEKKNVLSWFLSKEEPDHDYVPDLKSEWRRMAQLERVKFVIGAIVGLILLIGALFVVYLLLGAFIG